MISIEAKTMRLMYTYRRLILEGKIQLPPEAAVRFIGPDAAYRLYSSIPIRRAKSNARRKK